jgi:tRNA G10  N-methylase Trm11
MTKFIFIHGKNPDLSIAEIVSYLEARSVEFNIIEATDNFTIIDIQKIPDNMIDDLGGTIKIGEVLFSSNKKKLEEISKEIESRLNFNKLFNNFNNKVIFGVSSYKSKKEYHFFSNFFKEKMKKRGIKAGYFHVPRNRSALTHVEVIKKYLIGESIEFLICGKEKFYLGKTIGVHNPFEFQKRDVNRPEQRSIFSIPPRLCKIMINLSGGKGVLLDSFCGIGSILQEAVLMGFDIRGRDIDKNCINSCIKNLNWLSKEYKFKLKNIDKKIQVGDSRKLSNCFRKSSIDVVVTEPHLGPPLRKKPNLKKAKKIIQNLNSLYEKSIREMIKILKPRGRIVIISPSFKIENKIIGLDLNKIVKKYGGRVIDPLEKYDVKHDFPLLDYEERHKTLRKINIIKKDDLL